MVHVVHVFMAFGEIVQYLQHNSLISFKHTCYNSEIIYVTNECIGVYNMKIVKVQL